MTRYKLIQVGSPEELNAEVNRYLAAGGWKPFGSPFVSTGAPGYRFYAQAIVLENS